MNPRDRNNDAFTLKKFEQRFLKWSENNAQLRGVAADVGWADEPSEQCHYESSLGIISVVGFPDIPRDGYHEAVMGIKTASLASRPCSRSPAAAWA